MKGIKCRISNCKNILLAKGTICGTHRWRKNKYNAYDLPSYIGEPNYYVPFPPLPDGKVHKCAKHHGYLTIEEVYTQTNKGYSQYHCKLCVRDNNIRRNYAGMNSMEDYYKILESQNGVCAICKKQSNKRSNNGKTIKALAVDHCHKTGKVRGLLCDKCNTSLGHFCDSIEILQSAINYLKASQ